MTRASERRSAGGERKQTGAGRSRGGSASSFTPRRRRRREPSHDFTDAARGPRLQRVLADAGVASRRACEELITAGAVTVNGHVVDSLPAFVDPKDDVIAVNGRKIKSAEEHVYIMLFKPRGVVSTNADPEGRPLAIDLVEHPARTRLYPVGRLDLDSSGLLFLTNDGELANRMTHPRYGIHKTYEVLVSGALDPHTIARLERGLFLPDRRSGPNLKTGSKTAESHLEVVRKQADRTLLHMELREGRNRQVRRMMQAVGHPVKKLRRIKMGPLNLKGLRPGQWRELTGRELAALREAAFGKLKKKVKKTAAGESRTQRD